MSSPQLTLLPVVTFTPSVIQPRLLKVFGGSLPIRVTSVRLIPGAWNPEPGSAGEGEAGAGLSSVYTL